jgi:hypothetical protein
LRDREAAVVQNSKIYTAMDWRHHIGALC